MRILLVDDSVRIRSMIQSLLKREIHDLEEIRECTSCEEALALYGAVSPDWVLMDIKLPGMSGLEGTRRLMSEHPGANIVIVTQYDEPAYRDEARMVGARGYVLKDRLEGLPGVLRAGLRHQSSEHRETGKTQT